MRPPSLDPIGMTDDKLEVEFHVNSSRSMSSGSTSENFATYVDLKGDNELLDSFAPLGIELSQNEGSEAEISRVDVTRAVSDVVEDGIANDDRQAMYFPQHIEELCESLKIIHLNAELNTCIQYFWTSASGSRVPLHGLTRSQFVSFYCRLHKSILPGYEHDVVQRMGNFEWEREVPKPAKHISQVAFSDIIFRISHCWTHTLDVQEYLSFFFSVFNRIATVEEDLSIRLLEVDEVEPMDCETGHLCTVKPSVEKLLQSPHPSFQFEPDIEHERDVTSSAIDIIECSPMAMEHVIKGARGNAAWTIINSHDSLPAVRRRSIHDGRSRKKTECSSRLKPPRPILQSGSKDGMSTKRSRKKSGLSTTKIANVDALAKEPTKKARNKTNAKSNIKQCVNTSKSDKQSRIRKKGSKRGHQKSIKDESVPVAVQQNAILSPIIFQITLPGRENSDSDRS